MPRRSPSEHAAPCAANCHRCKPPWKGASNRITGSCCSRSSPNCTSWSPRCEPLLQEVEAQMEPYQAVVELLLTHPGVQATAAMGFVSEVGIDLSRFKSAKHFASWIGVCPGNHGSCWQTQAWQNHQGQSLSARVVGRDRLGHQPYQRQLPLGEVTPLSSSSWQNESDRGGLPHRGGELLPYDHEAYSLSGARRELL
jgi:Transposase IS116/IS110/IS902 family